MKYLHAFITFIFVIAMLVEAKSQTNKYEVGAYGGAGFSYIYGKGAKQLKKQNPLLGYSAGVGITFNMPKVAGIHIGVITEQKGFEWPIETMNGDGKPITYSYKARYHYVSFPVNLRLSAGKKVQFFASMGGYVSVLFRIRLLQKELMIDHVNPSGYQYADAGFCGGVGLRFNFIKHFSISIEARNSTGFMKVIKNTEPKDAIFNTSTSFIAGIAYCFKPWKQKPVTKK
jgi:hypothetical protein